MADPVEALIIDLLEWIEDGEKSYSEVMGAWRTSCPRLPVWEEANDRGLVRREYACGRAVITITPAGRELLRTSRRRGGAHSAPAIGAIDAS